ncbi:MAG: thiamine phosphate synthase [Lachnospiraceae bacterium]|nr:thiamine phosphate synthase [Lachnospiraceae bacterium]
MHGLQKQERPDPDIVIVREKVMGEEKYLEFFETLWKRCGCGKEEKRGARMIPHTYLSAANQTGSSCIHLPLPLLRTYQKEGALSEIEKIGVSVHSQEEAKEAEQLGAAYLTAGHVFVTDCKKGLPPRGLEFLEKICDNVAVPVYAIGGIHPDHLSQIRQTKAAGACMMSEYMRG